MTVSEQFVEAFLSALPAGFDVSPGGVNRTFAEAIGEAVERVMGRPSEKHIHYHPPEGAVMHAVGETVQIVPIAQDVDDQTIEQIACEVDGAGYIAGGQDAVAAVQMVVALLQAGGISLTAKAPS
jgi:hypothetical protein